MEKNEKDSCKSDVYNVNTFNCQFTVNIDCTLALDFKPMSTKNSNQQVAFLASGKGLRFFLNSLLNYDSLDQQIRLNVGVS